MKDMNWKRFTKDIPERGRMLFLDDKGHWFQGKLTDDGEYGLCISDHDHYWHITDITHYLIVELP